MWKFIFCILAPVATAVAAQGVSEVNTNTSRPFQAIVASLGAAPIPRQYEFYRRLSQGLMSEDYAAFSGQKDVPHFGHLVRELASQGNFDVLRELLKRREISPFKYSTIAELLAAKLDAAAFDLFLTNSSLIIPPTKGDAGFDNGKDIIAGEGIPDYSAFSLRHYLGHEIFGARAEAHLISILKNHKRTGVRAFAAEALGYSKSSAVIKPLEEAVSDKAEVPCSQCGNDYVGQYAEQALERIRKNP